MGKSSSTYKQSVLAFHSPDFSLPDFKMRPEGFGDSISNFFGFKDIDFPENEAFSNLYHLNGQDENAIRKVFTYNTMKHYENNPGWYIEAYQNKIILYKYNKRIDSDQIEEFMKEGLRAVSVFGVNNQVLS